MIQYQPETAYERLLARLSSMPNSLGCSARRKLRRAWAPKTIADFEGRVARLGPGDVAIDFGANVGLYTRKLAETGAEIHAYEPDPDSYALLCAATAGYENVICHRAAVGAEAARVRLFRAPAGQHAEFSEMASTVFAASRQYQFEAVDVDQHAFRDVLAGIGRPVALIKMDIEGAEFEILREIFADLSRWTFGAMFVETHETRATEWIPEIDRMRAVAQGLSAPMINLYWP